jgi:hypothetical protein
MSRLDSAILLAFMGGAVFGQPLNTPNGDLALVGGTIYASPAEEPIRDGVVLIHGGKIAAVGSRASLKVPQTVQSLDCSGLTARRAIWRIQAIGANRRGSASGSRSFER